ncbi:uncharacterized protein [Anabrus simplex]|uniref:uncharacterized protein isoform X2 n=1 Tax=Anabrus simplex TaxID=316456 RepID=UPI0035A39465
MLSSVCLVIAMALLAVECSNGPLCSSDEEIFHFSISSKKNSSLHRILQVDLTKCTAGTPNGSGEISLDVGHGRSLWNNSELIHLSTSVYGVSLSKSDYTKWGPGEPIGGNDKNFGGLNSQGLMVDIPNDWKLGFICEQEM